MRRLILALVIVALTVLVPYGGAAVSDPDPQQRAVLTSSMTLAELETRGDSARIQKDYRTAIDCYQMALKKDRNNAVLYNKMGIAQLLLQDYRSAQSSFNNSTKRNKNYAEPLNNLGVVAYSQKNYGRAVKYYKRALALSEANASFHANLGTAWFAQKKIDRAVVEYTRALELDPEVLLRITERGGVAAKIASPEERAQYMYLLAKLYAKRNDLEHSLECLKKAKEEGYKVAEVYKDQEFATLWQDPRLAELVPPPAPPK